MSDTPEADPRDALILSLWEHVADRGFILGTEDYELMKRIVLAAGVTEEEFVNRPAPVASRLRATVHRGESALTLNEVLALPAWSVVRCGPDDSDEMLVVLPDGKVASLARGEALDDLFATYGSEIRLIRSGGPATS